MAFIGNRNLELLLSSNAKVISPFDPEKIKNGAYELTLGAEVYLTDSKKRTVKNLADGEKIEIKPGQFALLLTQEYIKIPTNRIAFISIKAGIKFKGLINVSGFHVDPGFEGKLLFSVYNAGPSNIRLSSGTSYFPIWFAAIDQEDQDYKGSHEAQTRIPDGPVEALSQGELASPNVLSKRIDESNHLKTKIEWVALAIFTIVASMSLKVWTDSSDIKNAINYGFKIKSAEVVSDSTQKVMMDNITRLNKKVDSLTFLIKSKNENKK
jgi:dCTP deaminase